MTDRTNDAWMPLDPSDVPGGHDGHDGHDGPATTSLDAGDPANDHQPDVPAPIAAAGSRCQPVKPRIWTLFVALGAVVVGLLIGQVIVGALFGIYVVTTGALQDPSAMGGGSGTPSYAEVALRVQAMAMTPLGLIMFAAPTQLAAVATAMAAARWSPKPMIDRLGLRVPHMRWHWYPIFALATIVPFAISLAAASLGARLQSPDPGILRMWDGATWATGAALVAFIAIVPGFAEELFFRGYIQRRLIARWGPWAAILCTSVIFGLFHVMPAAIMLAFTLGIWLGVLAWRTGSIWPGAVCHAAVNGTWNAVQIGGRLLGFDMNPERTPTSTDWTVLGAILAVGIVFFILAISKLRRCAPTVATAA